MVSGRRHRLFAKRIASSVGAGQRTPRPQTAVVPHRHRSDRRHVVSAEHGEPVCIRPNPCRRKPRPVCPFHGVSRIVQQLAPLPQAAVLFHGNAMVISCRNRHPIVVLTDVHGHRTIRLRAVAQLAVMIRAPSPETPVSFQRQRMILAARHSRPIGIASHPHRVALKSGELAAVYWNCPPHPQRAVGLDCHGRTPRLVGQDPLRAIANQLWFSVKARTRSAGPADPFIQRPVLQQDNKTRRSISNARLDLAGDWRTDRVLRGGKHQLPSASPHSERQQRDKQQRCSKNGRVREETTESDHGPGAVSIGQNEQKNEEHRRSQPPAEDERRRTVTTK